MESSKLQAAKGIDTACLVWQYVDAPETFRSVFSTASIEDHPENYWLAYFPAKAKDHCQVMERMSLRKFEGPDGSKLLLGHVGIRK